ncbi:MAG TPA: M36 family metallopeptidase [Kofleriaceae bacterium]
MPARSFLLIAALNAVLACSTGDPTAVPAPSRPAAALVAIQTDSGGAAPRMQMALGREPAPASAATAVEQARAHLIRHAAELGATASRFAALEAARVTDSGRGGVVTTFRGRVAGLEVIGSDVRVLTRRDGSLAMVSGQAPPPLRQRPRFSLSSAQAFARALGAELGRQFSASDLTSGPGVSGGYATFRAAGVPLLDPCRIKPVLTASGDALVPAYRVEILRRDDAGRPRGAEYVIDAASGATLRSHRLESDASFQYRVWAGADKRPQDGPLADVTPHPTGTPNGLEPAPTTPSLIAMEAFNEPNDPWLAAAATTTSGNNVDAYADVGGGDGFDGGDVRATTTGTREFDRAYDLGDAPGGAAQRAASVTHLFYVNNWLHDWWYDSGFDESAGNAQADNLGRGGVEGDVLLAEAQDFSGTENANMMTPEDGVSPRMQMYLFRGPPQRDAALDTGIVAHEWGHYFHHRMQSCGTFMCAAMSEGWGDFVALHTVMRQGDAPNGTYAMGTYAAFDLVADLDGDAAYFGIRRAPYSRANAKNAFSFRHIAVGEALPDNHPLFSLGGDNNESHNAGEIWALMMFEAYQGLIDRSREGDYTFDEARRRMSDYAVGGLALSPADSTYLETRDAILAVAAAADPLDAQAMAAGFAKRGAGSCAVSPPFDSFDFVGVEEDTDLAPRLAIGGVAVDDSVTSCDQDGWLDGEETGLVRVTVANPGAGELSGGELTVASSSDGATFPDGATVAIPTVAPYGAVEVTVPVALAASDEIGDLTVSIDSTAPSACDTTAAAEFSTRVNLDEETASSRVDDVEAEATPWSATGAAEGEIWKRQLDDGANHVWHGEDAGFPSDAQLVSPAVTAGATLVLSFRHRHDFEFDGTYYDGGVIEISDDGGDSWRDASELGTVPYSGVITDASGNPLGNRNAFGGQSDGYPSMQPVSIDLGTSLAGKTVQVRFRVGTDAAVGAAGWDIDDIEFENIEETPFSSVNAEDGVCTETAGPDAGGDGDGDGDDGDGDGGCGCRAGDGGSSAAVFFLLLAVYWGAGRRRSRTKKESGRRAGPAA